ncbi:hypothetical protein [Streptomyces sp. NBC_00539]|uniref:hypothetical protein n=1 Tax=Streptomyces sp. NBC_00539 TaxID=2975770 RepID=UPI002E80A187|nr:hypothetical protein [Streptomyces sp. NBC_00539]WUC64160.1 hypothetical protein OG861_07850 [Streptomyces sp. NBC_00539]
MRRGIIAAVVAGAAGVTLGLMPVSGAFAATHTSLPQHSQQHSNYSRGHDSRDCGNSSRWNDDDSGNWRNAGWNHDHDNGYWNDDHGNWNDDNGNWNGGGWDNSSGYGHDDGGRW